MKERFKFSQKSKIEIIAGIILVLQIAVLCYFNLTHIIYIQDDDVAKLFRHTMEMWDERTLFIPNWSYITTGEQDCAALLAIPFYALTRNIYLAFGLSNIVNIFVYVYIINRLLKSVGVSETFRIIACLLVLFPYKFGQLDYLNMMFFSGGQYAYKVLLPLVFLELVYENEKARRKPVQICILTLYLLLLLLSSISSGGYVLSTGIAPAVISGILLQLARRKTEGAKWYEFILSCVSVLLGMIGMLIGERVGIQAYADTVFLLQQENWLTALEATVRSLINILGALPTRGDVPLLSINGMTYLIKFALMMFFVCLGCKRISSFLFLHESFEGRCTTDDKKKYLQIQLLSIFIWNFLIIFFSTQTGRYQLIGLIPLMLAAVIELSINFSKNNNLLALRLLLGGLLAGYVLMSLYTYRDAEKNYFTKDNQDVIELDEYLHQLNVGTAVFIWDTSMSERMRVYDDTILYTAYLPSEQKLYLIDYYQEASERSNLSDRNALCVKSNQSIDWVQDYIQNTYTLAGRVGDYTIYVSDVNRFDGISGMEFGNHAIDYPYTTGYTYKGEINSEGALLTDGVPGYALESPIFVNARKLDYSITMNYYAGIYEGTIGQVELWVDGSISDTQELAADKSQIVFEIGQQQNCQIRVKVDSDKSIAIQNFEFQENSVDEKKGADGKN